MTNKQGTAPERVYCGPDIDDGWRWPMASKHPEQQRKVEYVRADLFEQKQSEVDTLNMHLEGSALANSKLRAELATAKQQGGEEGLERGAVIAENFVVQDITKDDGQKHHIARLIRALKGKAHE